MLRPVVLVVVIVAMGGCAGPARPPQRTVGAVAAPSAYVVRVAGGAAGDAVRAELVARAGDDVLGDDGHVVRLSAAERDAMARRAGVVEITPLPAAARRRGDVAGVTGPREVRIDLFADVTDGERAEVVAWIAARGGEVRWQGPTALIATLPAEVVGAAASLSPVRWVE